jgi:hypothetical protein
MTEDDPKNWSVLRRRFEAFRSIKKLLTGPHETIPEALVRSALAEELGIKAEEVTIEQIIHAVARLLPQYPAITVIPVSQPEGTKPPALAGSPESAEFPKRASWLKARLKERNWGQSDITRHSGPDRKTIRKILSGEPVREDVLDRLARALSAKYHSVDITDIPSE